MTETFYRKKNYKDGTTFGGRIIEQDFDGYTSMANMANRIYSDWKFDEQCKRAAENRKRFKENKRWLDNVREN